MAVALVASLTSGCANLPQMDSGSTDKPAVSQIERAWQRNEQRLRAISDWQLNGRISIANDEEAWHGTLVWKQRGEHFDIRIIAPLGQGSAMLKGNDQQVSLRTSQGGYFKAKDADSLLSEHLGWQLPVNSLHAWVRGLPSSATTEGQAKHRQTLDSHGNLASLKQDGWNIEYGGYKETSPALPGTVFLNQAPWRVRLAVTEWK